MKVRFWGVRGSTPVPGPSTERYGGNTSCVEVMTAAGTRLVLDAGTGLRALGQALMQESSFERGRGVAHLLISHTHWDHIHGLPFFAPLFHKGSKLELYARASNAAPLRAIFSTPPPTAYFPTVITQPAAELGVHQLADDARFAIADARVACARLNHPFGATAYAVTTDEAKVVYVTDTAPFADILFGEEFVGAPPPPGATMPAASREILRAMHAALVRLCEGADLVVYDTMFTAEDYQKTPHYGHSRPEDALAICRDAGARTLALYHHAPERSDAELDVMLASTRALAARLSPPVSVIAAYEGLEVELGGRAWK